MNIFPNSTIKYLYTKKLSQDEVKAIKKEIVQNTKEITLYVSRQNTQPGNGLNKAVNEILKNSQDFQSFLQSIGYDGKKSIADLSKEGADRVLKEMFEKGNYKQLDLKI